MEKAIAGKGITLPPRLLMPRIHNDLTRRDFLTGAGSILVLGAAGCGGSGSGEETTSSENARTIEHKYGSTEISGIPERIVTVGLTEQDYLLALDVVPVGTREWFGEYPGALWPWAREALGDRPLPEVLPVDELNFEQVAALEPDLILGLYSGLTRDEYDTLSEIAPTVAQPGEHVDYGVPWQEQTRTIGRALGKEEQAGELVAEVEARFAGVREEHPEFGGATGVVVLPGEGGTYYPYGPQDSRGRFMDALGFELPDEIAELAGDDFFATISGERLDLLDTDVLVWIATEAQREAIEDEPLYQQLDVVGEGRDIFLETNEPLAGALSFSTVLSIPYALENLLPILAAAVDGDPETEVEGAS